MPTTRTVTVRFPLVVNPFIRGIHDAHYALLRVGAAAAGRPCPPRPTYPRRASGMTARQYRADRRRFGREVRAYRRAVRGTVAR